MIERAHLRIIQALADQGSLTAAANSLHLTQSALSHQIRYLEAKMEVKLWQKEGRKLRLTQAGNLLLRVAGQVLPVLEQAEQTLEAFAEGKQGILRIGVECHPCYEWLKTVLGSYLKQMPLMDVDVVDKFQFSGLEGLLNHHIDILVTPDELPTRGVSYIPLFDYELVLLIPAQHRLADKQSVTAQALENEVLMTFPVAQQRLDIFTRFFVPAAVQPRHKTLESLDIMVQMVSLGRGLTVLPDWLAQRISGELPVSTVRLGAGLDKTLYAAVRDSELDVSYLKEFVLIAKDAKL